MWSELNLGQIRVSEFRRISHRVSSIDLEDQAYRNNDLSGAQTLASFGTLIY